MRPRCLWTNTAGDDLVELRLGAGDPLARLAGSEVVHVRPEHEAALRDFADRADRFGRLFLALIGASCVGLVGFGVAGSHVGAGASLAFMGLVVQAFPFCTPQTVEMFGVGASRVIARVAGVALGLLGVALGWGLLD